MDTAQCGSDLEKVTLNVTFRCVLVENYVIRIHYKSNFPGTLWPQRVRPGDIQHVAWR